MNPLANIGGNNMGNLGNVMQMMQKFQQFRNSFPKNANPNEILNSLVNSGKFTNDQVNQAKEIVKQIGMMK